MFMGHVDESVLLAGKVNFGFLDSTIMLNVHAISIGSGFLPNLQSFLSSEINRWLW